MGKKETIMEIGEMETHSLFRRKFNSKTIQPTPILHSIEVAEIPAPICSRNEKIWRRKVDGVGLHWKWKKGDTQDY